MMCKQDKAVYCFPNACMWDANGIVSWEPQSLPFKFDRKSMLDLFVLPAAISVFKSVFSCQFRHFQRNFKINFNNIIHFKQCAVCVRVDSTHFQKNGDKTDRKEERKTKNSLTSLTF